MVLKRRAERPPASVAKRPFVPAENVIALIDEDKVNFASLIEETAGRLNSWLEGRQARGTWYRSISLPAEIHTCYYPVVSQECWKHLDFLSVVQTGNVKPAAILINQSLESRTDRYSQSFALLFFFPTLLSCGEGSSYFIQSDCVITAEEERLKGSSSKQEQPALILQPRPRNLNIIPCGVESRSKKTLTGSSAGDDQACWNCRGKKFWHQTQKAAEWSRLGTVRTRWIISAPPSTPSKLGEQTQQEAAGRTNLLQLVESRVKLHHGPQLLSLSLSITSLHFIPSSSLDTFDLNKQATHSVWWQWNESGDARCIHFWPNEIFAHYLHHPQICLAFRDEPDAS